jgi:hypothetical protein
MLTRDCFQMEISVIRTVECTIAEEGSGEGSTAVDSNGTIKKDEFYSRTSDLERGEQ